MARKRNYKAEYERRKAKGLAAGKTIQQSRGHKPREHVERKERSLLKYGLPPEQLRQLRLRAARHIMAELKRTGTLGRINEKTITKGMRYLGVHGLDAILHAFGDTIKIQAMFQEGHYIPDTTVFYETVTRHNAFAMLDYGTTYAGGDDDDEIEYNPFWYH
jgi:hypothetical protein